MSKLSRRLAILAVIAATAFGVTTGVASAGPPTGVCPPPFSLVPIDPDHTPAGTDKNGDGMVCVQDIPPSGDNWTDNNSQAKGPPS